MSAPAPRSTAAQVASAAPGLARLAVSAWWRTTTWATGAYVRAGVRVVRAAASGEPPQDLLAEAGAELRRYARRLLEIVDPEMPADRYAAEEEAARHPEPSSNGTHPSLRERGAELLRRSAELGGDEDDEHPAFARILTELAPDEARILRLLHQRGAQPSVDVRAGAVPLNAAMDLVAPGLTMIGAEAGCRRPGRVPSYLNNLYRLGLVWFSREPIKDNSRYQVLEAQPDVLEALKRNGRGRVIRRTVRRSIELTPFGSEFCTLCLPETTEEIEALAPEGQPEKA